MPNWCNNTLFVSGPKAEVEAFIKKAAGKDDRKGSPLSFNSLVPRNINAKRYQNAHEHGCDGTSYGNPNFNWYDWQVDNWGCKWDCSEAELEVSTGDGTTDATFTFQTAWAPPTEFYKAITKKFKALTFDAYAWEPGMSFWCHFCGEHGVIAEDEEEDIDQTEKLEDAINERLDDLGFDTESGDLGELKDSIDCWYLDEGDLTEIPEACVIIDDTDENFIKAAKEAGFKKARKKK